MIYWLTAVVSLVGVWLNIKKHVACFWLWMATNATWAWADFTHGLPQQGSLHIVYVGLALYGARQWSREPPPRQ